MDRLITEHVIPALVGRGVTDSGAVAGPTNRMDVDVVQAVGDPVVRRPTGPTGPAEVHVHIGRVEVRKPASPPSPAQTPAPIARSAPTPDHEAYLTRRREDRR